MDKTIETLTLVTVHGDSIRVEFPTNTMEEVLEDFMASRERGGYWHVGNWNDASALYKGHRLDDINMSLVIGTT